jgi:hypothetical protein
MLRRGFIKTIVAIAAAPAILMGVSPRPKKRGSPHERLRTHVWSPMGNTDFDDPDNWVSSGKPIRNGDTLVFPVN